MEEQTSAKRQRAFELDFLRGFALFLMVFMHFSYDIRYIFKFKTTFEYLESTWFWVFIEPLFLCIFVTLYNAGRQLCESIRHRACLITAGPSAVSLA